jgi:transaldolase
MTADLKIKLFADGADLAEMKSMASKEFISGLTTNPTLMRKAGVTDYREFAKQVLSSIKDKPISFEVFSEDVAEMKSQAIEIASWGYNVNVKIPVTNSRGESNYDLIRELTLEGIKINVTAVMSYPQIENSILALSEATVSYLSIFAGRIADTGRDPSAYIEHSLRSLEGNNAIEVIWASPRELLNIFQAEKVGCHIITATKEILNKLEIYGKDLEEYSLETVQMFNRDAKESQYRI